MIVFHGSYAVIAKPNLLFSRNNVDFGKGFYTTPFKEQAKHWAERFKREAGKAFIYVKFIKSGEI